MERAIPLTAREILELLDEMDDTDEVFESTHEMTTVLGRRALTGDVRAIRSSPYRYELYIFDFVENPDR